MSGKSPKAVLLELKRRKTLRSIVDDSIFKDYYSQVTGKEDMSSLNSQEVYKLGKDFLDVCEDEDLNQGHEDSFTELCSRIKHYIDLSDRVGPLSANQNMDVPSRQSGRKDVDIEREKANYVGSVSDIQAVFETQNVVPGVVAPSHVNQLEESDQEMIVDEKIDEADQHFIPTKLTEDEKKFGDLNDLNIKEVMRRPKLWKRMLQNKQVLVKERKNDIVDMNHFEDADQVEIQQPRTKKCLCYRSLKFVYCTQCNTMMEGRIRRVCTQHPKIMYLLDIAACCKCKSGTDVLQEYEIPDCAKKPRPACKIADTRTNSPGTTPTIQRDENGLTPLQKKLQKRTATPGVQEEKRNNCSRQSARSRASSGGMSSSQGKSPGNFSSIGNSSGKTTKFQVSQRANNRLRRRD